MAMDWNFSAIVIVMTLNILFKINDTLTVILGGYNTASQRILTFDWITQYFVLQTTELTGSRFLSSCAALKKQGVNFINILRAHYSYKSALHNFSLVTFWLCNFLAQTY
jgi:hypothetical protein